MLTSKSITFRVEYTKCSSVYRAATLVSYAVLLGTNIAIHA